MKEYKKGIKFQMYISEAMDDSITQISKVMGVSKAEYVRMCVAQGSLGYENSINLMREFLLKSGE